MTPRNRELARRVAVVVAAIAISAGLYFVVASPLRQAEKSRTVAIPITIEPIRPDAPASSKPTAGSSPNADSQPRQTAAAPQASPGAAAARRATPKPKLPAFDIVRVEPTGEALIAGRGQPDAEVELLANGEVLGKARTNESGEFVLTPAALPAGSHELKLRAPASPGDNESRQAVVVSVPERGRGDVLVVVNEPGKPSNVLKQSGPEIAAAPAPSSAAAGGRAAGDARGTRTAEASPQTAARPSEAGALSPQSSLRIGAVEVEGGRLFVQGTGAAGSRALIYLNNAPIARAQVGPDGRWSLTVERGVTPGRYDVRVDQLDDKGAVVARAEVPFSYEPQIAAASQSRGAPSPQPSGQQPAGLPRSMPAGSAPGAPPSGPTPESVPEAQARAPGMGSPADPRAAPAGAQPPAESSAATQPVPGAAAPSSFSASASPPAVAAQQPSSAQPGGSPAPQTAGAAPGGRHTEPGASETPASTAVLSEEALRRSATERSLPPVPPGAAPRPPEGPSSAAASPPAPPSGPAPTQPGAGQTAALPRREVGPDSHRTGAASGAGFAVDRRELAAASTSSANPVVQAISTVQVRRGDSLWRISRQLYGRGARYTVIYEANEGQIRNPNRIYPDQIFVTPTDN